MNLVVKNSEKDLSGRRRIEVLLVMVKPFAPCVDCLQEKCSRKPLFGCLFEVRPLSQQPHGQHRQPTRAMKAIPHTLPSEILALDSLFIWLDYLCYMHVLRGRRARNMNATPPGSQLLFQIKRTSLCIAAHLHTVVADMGLEVRIVVTNLTGARAV